MVEAHFTGGPHDGQAKVMDRRTHKEVIYIYEWEDRLYRGIYKRTGISDGGYIAYYEYQGREPVKPDEPEAPVK